MVKLITTTSDLISLRHSQIEPVGIVPTMGNLHAGHISLLERALSHFKTVYFTIFVNPKQFGPNDDFHRYPRTLENDLALISKTLEKYPNSEVIVFSPKDPTEVFPEGSTQSIKVEGLSDIVEGKMRPGHFEGVATVVWRLFDLMKPSKAYFGLKDYQQYLVIKQMVKDLVMPIEIVGMPIVRETSGLAMSSRNQYLSDEQRNLALHFDRTLNKLKDIISGKRSELPKAYEFIRQEKENTGWNYLEIRDAETFAEDVSLSPKITIVGVYQQGTTRLLDNLQVELS